MKAHEESYYDRFCVCVRAVVIDIVSGGQAFVERGNLQLLSASEVRLLIVPTEVKRRKISQRRKPYCDRKTIVDQQFYIVASLQTNMAEIEADPGEAGLGYEITEEMSDLNNSVAYA